MSGNKSAEGHPYCFFVFFYGMKSNEMGGWIQFNVAPPSSAFFFNNLQAFSDRHDTET